MSIQRLDRALFLCHFPGICLGAEEAVELTSLHRCHLQSATQFLQFERRSIQVIPSRAGADLSVRMIKTHVSACPGWPEWNPVCHCACSCSVQTAPHGLSIWITCNWLFSDHLYLILFQIWGSTLHWVLVLYKLWGSTCCPGCMAVAAYEKIEFSSCANSVTDHACQ